MLCFSGVRLEAIKIGTLDKDKQDNPHRANYIPFETMERFVRDLPPYHIFAEDICKRSQRIPVSDETILPKILPPGLQEAAEEQLSKHLDDFLTVSDNLEVVIQRQIQDIAELEEPIDYQDRSR